MNSDDIVANRLKGLMLYPFEKLDRLCREARTKGVRVIDFGVGEPDFSPPELLKNSLIEGIRRTRYYLYPTYAGAMELREAFCNFFHTRYGIKLDPIKECLILIGSKEGICHLPCAIVNPGELVQGVEPAYPVYKAGAILADADYKPLSLSEERQWLPNPGGIDKNAKLLFINSPSNPTGEVYPISLLEEIVKVGRKNNIIIANDAAYAEIYFDKLPPSILQVDGAKDVAVEFHSTSKTFGVPGFRVGFLVGNSKVITALSALKRNIDSGQFVPLQLALAEAYKTPSLITKIIKRYIKRRAIFSFHLPNWKLPKATFYIWGKVPDGYTSDEFAERLIKEAGIVVLPGSSLGSDGEGFIRFSLTLPEKDISDGASRIKELLMNG